MSDHAPGWYPDGSGRYAQRYYDGASWTAHVVDGSGRRSEDHVPGVTVPGTSPTVAGISPATTMTGTTASRFQFGAAPTHDQVYARPTSSPVPATPMSPSRRTGGGRGALAAVLLVGLALVVVAVVLLG